MVIRPDRPEFACIDLFCGCGGNSWGMLSSGQTRPIAPLLALDLNETALSTYRRNMPGVTTMLEDIRQVAPRTVLSGAGLRKGELGCLVASPPCQTYSRNNRQPKDADDHRNTLYEHTLKMIAGLKPWVVFMENVPEMETVNGGAYHRDFLGRVKALGYTVGHWVVDAAEYGVPQHRNRLIYLAYRASMRALPQVPRPTHGEGAGLLPWVTVAEAIGDLPARDAGQGPDTFDAEPYPEGQASGYARERLGGQRVTVRNHAARPLNDIQLTRVRALSEGQAYAELPDEVRPANGYKASYGRLWRNRPAPTLTTYLAYPSSGRHSHYEQDRVITIREALRLQAFDDVFSVDGPLVEQSAQVGNAVPPLLAAAFRDVIAAALEKHFARRARRSASESEASNGEATPSSPMEAPDPGQLEVAANPQIPCVA